MGVWAIYVARYVSTTLFPVVSVRFNAKSRSGIGPSERPGEGEKREEEEERKGTGKNRRHETLVYTAVAQPSFVFSFPYLVLAANEVPIRSEPCFTCCSGVGLRLFVRHEQQRERHSIKSNKREKSKRDERCQLRSSRSGYAELAPRCVDWAGLGSGGRRRLSCFSCVWRVTLLDPGR